MSSTSPDGSGTGGSPVPVIKACDMCRKKKIRCEPTGQTCQQCIKYRTHCHFTPISTKRAARRPAGHEKVEELEKRLKSMEESLRQATEKKQSSATGDEIVRNVPSLILADEVASTSFTEQLFQQDPASPSLTGSWVMPTPDDLSMFVHIAPTQISQLGPTTMPMWKLTPTSTLFTPRVFKPLPSQEQAFHLAKLAFQGFNAAFPIFDEDVFVTHLNTQQHTPDNPAWWACLNVVLALAHRFRVMEMYQNDVEEEHAWGYFQNALSVVNELNLLQPSLMAIQALLGMAVVVQGTPNPAPFTFLNSAAMRMCQRMGLHRNTQDPIFTPAEIEQRRRVFWIAYAMDKDACIRTGDPPSQDDSDMDVEFPAYCEQATNELSGNSFFKLRLKFALIQGQIYRRLLSVRASKQSVAGRVVVVRDLESKLERWKASVPMEYQQEYHSQVAVARSDISRILHSVILRLTYFHALQAIYRFSTPVDNWQARMDHPMDYYDANLVHELPAPVTCVDEARKALRLLLVTPQGDFACIWVVLHIFVSATTTLLTSILAYPTSSTAQSDLLLIEPLLRLLGLLSMKGKSAEVEGMYSTCRTKWEYTRKKVWEAKGRTLAENNRGMLPTSREMGGKNEEKESVEEFIRRIESITAWNEGMFEYAD